MDTPIPSDASSGGGAPVSLRQVATAAGVSRMTVSRAFKEGSPVKSELRARVLEVARRLGYEPDRMVTELMSSFVKRRPVRYRETFAALWWPERWPGGTRPVGFLAGLRQGLEQGAARHGFGLEHIVLPDERGARALERMLKARGIHGILLTPPMRADTLAPKLDWGAFSAVIIGSSLREPRLHRAQASHYAAMVEVLETVRRRGYRRPCLLVGRDLEERMQRAYAAAFLAWEDNGSGRIWHAPDVWSQAELDAWLSKEKPDVVIADTDSWRLALPRRGIGFVSLAVEDPAGPVTGNHQNFARVAEGAVDLLAQARIRHETGEPRVPLIVTTAGEWVEGETLRGPSRAKGRGRR